MANRVIVVPVLMSLVLAASAGATASLTLEPGGAISGTVGQTIGWGYTLVNDQNYLVVTSARFVGPTPVLGTFSDFVAARNFRVVGPPPESSSVAQAFDAATGSGIGSVALVSGASPFVTNAGRIVLTYDLYSVSPNSPSFDPVLHTISTGNRLSADASVTRSLANDADRDGLTDALDNCPFYGLLDPRDTDGDGRGDVCECGDQNGDGRSTVADLVAINLAIFNPALVSALCDANGDSRCSVADIVSTNIEIFSPGNTSTCARQPVPGP